jgi:hypothetical protein
MKSSKLTPRRSGPGKGSGEPTGDAVFAMFWKPGLIFMDKTADALIKF